MQTARANLVTALPIQSGLALLPDKVLISNQGKRITLQAARLNLVMLEFNHAKGNQGLPSKVPDNADNIRRGGLTYRIKQLPC